MSSEHNVQYFVIEYYILNNGSEEEKSPTNKNESTYSLHENVDDIE